MKGTLLRTVAATLLLLAGLLIPHTATPTLAQTQDPPTGTLASGRIDPVRQGNLHVGVLDITIAPSTSTDLSGPSAFLINDQQELQVSGLPQGTLKLTSGAAAFLPGGEPYKITNGGNAPARFRFVGMGGKGEVHGAQYEMEPIPWGPGAGKLYEVSVTRSFFSPNSATPWHYHNGPAFGIMDAGATWENRQVDGPTRRIPTPGYYVQYPLKVHQLAQVGTGAYARNFQFAPPSQPLTGGGPAIGQNTPTVLSFATPIPTSAARNASDTATSRSSPSTPSTTPGNNSSPDRTTAATALAGRPLTPTQPDNSLLYAVLILGAAIAGVLWMRRSQPK